MIILTIIVDETDGFLSSEGIVTALKPTKREEQLTNGLLEAVEQYCMKSRGKEGAMFARRPLPEANGKEDEVSGK